MKKEFLIPQFEIENIENDVITASFSGMIDKGNNTDSGYGQTENPGMTGGGKNPEDYVI